MSLETSVSIAFSIFYARFYSDRGPFPLVNLVLGLVECLVGGDILYPEWGVILDVN